MNYVIIGNSTAGIAAAEGIRSRDEKGNVTIVSEEKFTAYGRPLISYYLSGATDRERMSYRPADFYERNRIRLLAGVRAVKIVTDKKELLLSDGSALVYDRLLVATGSRPFQPPMQGIERVREKFCFQSLQDALDLEKALAPHKRVLIVGAGLIGLKCMEGILNRVGSVTVVDLADRVLPSILDEYGASLVRADLEARGVRFRLSDGVERFEENAAYLKSGAKIDFDILVTAVGVRPNTELVAEAGGEVSRGIVTNERQETTLRGVYAAGDCTESFDASSGTRRILAVLPNAYRQGYCAGINMAGGENSVGALVPLNAIGFFGSHILTAGAYVGESYTEKGDGRYKKLFYEDGVLKGFILVNAPERAGIYTALVKNRTPLSEIDFELIKKEPMLAAFSANEREEMLAREV